MNLKAEHGKIKIEAEREIKKKRSKKDNLKKT